MPTLRYFFCNIISNAALNHSHSQRHGEYERARVIYRHAVDTFQLGERNDHKVVEDAEDVADWEKEQRKELYKAYVSFEKKFGDKDGVEKVDKGNWRVSWLCK